MAGLVELDSGNAVVDGAEVVVVVVVVDVVLGCSFVLRPAEDG